MTADDYLRDVCPKYKNCKECPHSVHCGFDENGEEIRECDAITD